MNKYLDISNKFIYYKEQILKQFIEKGIYPTDTLIAKYINDIDLNLSIFKNYNKSIGQKFNVNEYNESLKSIYLDLSILYSILNELSINEYNNLQNYIYSYLNELSSIVNTYKTRADYENNSTTLGETLLFQNNNFTIEHNNSTTIYNLNDITINAGSLIACIANVNNINNDNIVFHLYNNEDDIKTIPYNLNSTLLTIPGNKTINTYDYSISDEQNINSSLTLNINTEINDKNKYIILGGKDKLLINDKNNKCSLVDIPNSSGSLLFKEKTDINFYVYKGKNISFKFNKKPLIANFPLEQQNITITEDIQFFHIECDEDFYLEIELNEGNIYAINEKGIINNNVLYYIGKIPVQDFKILEISAGEEKTYKVQLIIYNDNDNNSIIDNIVIKKIE